MSADHDCQHAQNDISRKIEAEPGIVLQLQQPDRFIREGRHSGESPNKTDSNKISEFRSKALATADAIHDKSQNEASSDVDQQGTQRKDADPSSHALGDKPAGHRSEKSAKTDVKDLRKIIHTHNSITTPLPDV